MHDRKEVCFDGASFTSLRGHYAVGIRSNSCIRSPIAEYFISYMSVFCCEELSKLYMLSCCKCTIH
eukprot:1393891-Pleurochrysis_carterae.AAC.2